MKAGSSKNVKIRSVTVFCKQRSRQIANVKEFLMNANSTWKHKDLWRCNILASIWLILRGKRHVFQIKKSFKSSLTTENSLVWPLYQWVSVDNSAPKNSQSCWEVPRSLKALGVDGRDFYVKRLIFLKSSWKTASHKYQPAISMDFYRKTGTPSVHT